jgi:hypothetical protein
LPLLDAIAFQEMSIAESHDISFLEQLCEEVAACMADIRTEKRTGRLDLHFSQGEIASLELCDTYTPGNAVGSYDSKRCAKVAALRVRWFMKQKKSGRVSLLFEQGDIASVQTFQRFMPGRKIGSRSV